MIISSSGIGIDRNVTIKCNARLGVTVKCTHLITTGN